ncbi:hypothetical protein GBA52_020308 [Prunus armeniaca]|nr:hypothetical protein GBA52_020308 [Prunus armeniaca]
MALKPKIAVTLCQMENIFPSSFFVVIVHSIMHLADEAAIVGPTPYRWMYPIERHLQTLKKYLWNKSYPEGSMEQGYLVDEGLAMCTMYLSNVETRRNQKGRNANGIGRGVKFLTLQVILRVQVNKYILTKMSGTNVAELSCSIAMKFSPF